MTIKTVPLSSLSAGAGFTQNSAYYVRTVTPTPPPIAGKVQAFNITTSGVDLLDDTLNVVPCTYLPVELSH